MARLGIFNFEGSMVDHFAVNPSPTYPSTIVTALHGKACSLSTGYAYLRLDLPSAKSEIYLAFALQCTSNNSAQTLVEFRSGTTILAKIRRYAERGQIGVFRGSWTTFLAESSGRGLVPNVPALLEIYYKPHTSSGVVTVKLNGIQVIHYTGNTSASGSTLDNVLIGNSLGTVSTNQYIDNTVIDDANWPGDTLQAMLKPSGTGNSAQWDVAGGANYTAVDEAPIDDKDAVYTNTIDEVDSYALEDLPAEADTIKCVLADIRGVLEGSPTPTKILPGVRTAGTDYFGSAITMDELDMKHALKVWETNPNTSAAWTPSEINSLEVALKSGA